MSISWQPSRTFAVCPRWAGVPGNCQLAHRSARGRSQPSMVGSTASGQLQLASYLSVDPLCLWPLSCARGHCRVPVAIVGVKADSVLRYQPADWAPIRMDNGAQGGGLAPIRVVDLRAVLVEVPDEGISVNGRQ